MPVKIYVSRDSRGQPWPPDYDHEAWACIEAIKKLWLAFNSQPEVYAVAANLHWPNADFVVLSQRGIGVCELKHSFGPITQRSDGVWYAGSTPIKGGVANEQARKNPHEQVQSYAGQIRDKLLRPTRPPAWLPGQATDWAKFKFQTAVCFTNPDVRVDAIRDSIRRRQPTNAWEEFSILTLADFPEWAAALRFEVDQGRSNNFEPHRLAPTYIERIATGLLRLTEWTEIINLMPTGEPYAYLVLHEGEKNQVFALDREEIIVGRDPNACNLLVPERFSRVSLQHARIIRQTNGIYIEDMGSTNGVYIDGVRIHQVHRLKRRQAITLGKPTASGTVCLFEFLLELDNEYQPSRTDADTGAKPKI